MSWCINKIWFPSLFEMAVITEYRHDCQTRGLFWKGLITPCCIFGASKQDIQEIVRTNLNNSTKSFDDIYLKYRLHLLEDIPDAFDLADLKNKFIEQAKRIDNFRAFYLNASDFLCKPSISKDHSLKPLMDLIEEALNSGFTTDEEKSTNEQIQHWQASLEKWQREAKVISVDGDITDSDDENH